MTEPIPIEGKTCLYTGHTGGRRRSSKMSKKFKKTMIRHTKKVRAAYKKFLKLARKRIRGGAPPQFKIGDEIGSYTITGGPIELGDKDGTVMYDVSTVNENGDVNTGRMSESDLIMQQPSDTTMQTGQPLDMSGQPTMQTGQPLDMSVQPTMQTVQSLDMSVQPTGQPTDSMGGRRKRKGSKKTKRRNSYKKMYDDDD